LHSLSKQLFIFNLKQITMNLLSILTNTMTGGGTLGAISGLLGESEAATKSGLGAILPTVLGSVISKGSTAQGAGGIMDMLKSGGHDGGLLDNFGSILGGGGSGVSNLLSSGGGIVSSLLGDKVGGVVNLISGLTGLKSGSATSLMSMAAPMVMGLIGKQTASQGLNASGLMSMLGGQSEFVKAAMPAGVSSLLGFGNLGGAADAAKSAMSSATSQATAAVDEAKGGIGSMLPYILGAAVLVGSFLAYRSCETPKAELEKVADVAKTTVTAGADSLTAKAGSMIEAGKAMLPGGVSLDIPKGSLEEKMLMFIESKDTVSKKLWFDFDRLLFETGKSSMKPESMEQLKNVAAIMKAFPNVKIKIGGYTDNVGKPESNMKLSAERAANVMAELVKLGTAAPRMESEGYGSANPVAPNDTKEGQAKNRRISISVRSK
jgi:OmpA-OmpF porin, OOP family